MIQNKTKLQILAFALYPVALTLSVQNDPFFWDTVQLASKHAHYFFENGLRWLPLPQEIDSGHPPVFGYYLAHIWAVFGKTLPASHWAMLPFLLLNVRMLYLLGLRLGGEGRAFWLIPLVFLDPVMAGQSVMVSPDIVVTCGFLLTVEGILGKNRFFTAAGILLLCMVSVRGMMTAAALAAWVLLRGFDFQHFRFPVSRVFRFAAQRFGPFIPGFAFALWFFWWHKAATGWIGLHPGSPWAPTFEPAKGPELLRNLLVIGWRWLDFGRVFEWLLLGWLVVKSWPAVKKNAAAADLLILLICVGLFLSPSALLFKNVSAHRYFLPGFLALHLFVFQIFALQKANFRHFSVAFTALIICFAAGNLWIYPRGVAMGWDATLAHLPYHRLRKEAVAYLEEKNIDFQSVGSFFPNLNTGENLMLNGDRRRFADIRFSANDYVFASNIFNDISDADYAVLGSEWVLEKRWQHAIAWSKSGVWIEIYRKKE